MKYILPITALCSAALLTACGDDDAAVNEAVKGSISLSGTARVNETLSINNDYRDRNGIERNTPSYQWYGTENNATDAIVGATAVTYKLTGAEFEKDVHVVMDFLDDDGFAETLTSDSMNVFYPYTVSLVTPGLTADPVSVLQSTDLGAVWTDATSPVSGGSESHTTPSIAADGKGNLVLVSVSTGEFGADKDIIVSSSNDNGATWSNASLLIDNNAEDDIDPMVATDKNGTWVVVWSSGADLQSATTSDKDIFYVTSTNNGNAWGDPVLLNKEGTTDGTNDDTSPQISMVADKWTVAWATTHNTSDVGTDIEIFSIHSANAGESWNAPVLVSKVGDDENSSDDTLPRMSINESGRGVLIWSGVDVTDGDLDIYGATSSNSGEGWSTGKAINSYAATDKVTDNDYASGVASFSNGTTVTKFVVSWHGSNESDGSTTGDDVDAFYSISNISGSAWEAAKTVNPNAVTDGTGDNETQPIFLAKPNGEWIVTWNDAADAIYTRTSKDLSAWDTVVGSLSKTSTEKVSWVFH